MACKHTLWNTKPLYVYCLLILTALQAGCQSTSQQQPVDKPVATVPAFDWQGHRGARGLLPENSISGFLLAADTGVTTLEMDVVVTADSQLVLSHEPWMSHEICRSPVGEPIDTSTEKQHAIYRMTLPEVQRYNCGSWCHPRFPQQQPMIVHKPTLAAVVVAISNWEQQHGGKRLWYNIETKSTPDWEAAGLVPTPARFAQLLITEIHKLGITDRTTIQSFDVRTLQAAKQLDANIPLVLLVENTDGYDANLQRLGFKPAVYSPNDELVDSVLVARCHADGIRIIPWTVNEVADMQRLIGQGVDGLISDYPDRYAQLRSE